MHIQTFTAPASWACYLINGDHSGLSDEEQAEADDCIAEHVQAYGSCHVSDCSEPEFYAYKPLGAFGSLGGDYCEYTFLV